MAYIENTSLIKIVEGKHMIQDVENTVLIQIIDPDKSFPVPKFKFKEIHQFKFFDAEDSTEDISEDTKVSKQQAKEIADILSRCLKENKNVLVHCTAGRCRSGSVAEVGTIIGFKEVHNYRQPNTRLKTMLLREFGLTYD